MTDLSLFTKILKCVVWLALYIQITTEDLLEAAQLEEGGHPDARPRSMRMLLMLALNEASMAAIAANFTDLKEIQLVIP